jgi:hypothetical protein
MTRYRRGRLLAVWLTEAQAEDLDAMCEEFATSTGRASISRIVRQALDELAVDALDRRRTDDPVPVDRRTSAGRRAYDESRALVQPWLVDARRRRRSTG